MRRFVLVGASGSFQVPVGESRIGSDASCDICIRGEGILPTHAYLRSEEEKLHIRPAESRTSGGEGEAGGVRINGTAVNGPTVLGGGEEIVVGSVPLKVVASGSRRSLWSYRWIRMSVWGLAGLFALVLSALAVVKFYLLDEARLRSEIQQYVAVHLLRDETEIDSIDVSLKNGTITVTNMRFHERDSFVNEQEEAAGKLKRREGEKSRPEPFARVASLNLKMDVWPFLRSGFRDFSNLHIVLNNPQIDLDRSRNDGNLNVDDIIQKYLHGTKAPPLAGNLKNVRLEIKGGRIKLNDPFMRSAAGTPIGSTALDNIQADLFLARQGDPLEIRALTASATSFPEAHPPGALSATGQINAIDSSGAVDLQALRNSGLKLALTDFDMARVFEHFGYAWEPVGFDVKVMLGKPITGGIELRIEDLQNIGILGTVQTQSLVAVKAPDRPAVGDLPTKMSFDVKFSQNNKGYYRPVKVDIGLVSGKDLKNPASTFLSFNAVGQLNPGGTSEYSVSLDECVLQELLGTDVARRLGLDGRIGGRLLGKQKVVIESNNNWSIDARMEGKDTYVLIPSAAKDAPPLRQPLPLSFETYATAKPEPDGTVNEISVQRFKMSGGSGGGLGKPSFEIRSEMLGIVTGLARQGALQAHAKFGLALRGKEFWQEFSPFLALFGLTRPVEEALDLQISLLGNNDFVEVGASGTAARQWAIDPARVNLRSLITYNRKAFQPKPAATAPADPVAPAADATVPPYLTAQLVVVSDGGKPLNVTIDAQCKRTETHETIILERFEDDDAEHKTPKPGLFVMSDLVELRERFKPYIEGLLENWDLRAGNAGLGLLHKYRDLNLTGEVEYRGRVEYTYPLHPRSADPDRLSFDMAMGAKSLTTTIPLEHLVSAGVPAAAEKLEKNALFNWSEPAALFALKGRYTQKISTNKEEPNTELLSIDKLDVQASVGAFQLSGTELDLFRWRNLRSLRNLTWSDCAAAFGITGRVDAPAFSLLRALRITPVDFPFQGTMDVQASYDRKADRMQLKKFIFNQTEKKPDAFLTRVDINAAVQRVRDLSLRLTPTNAEDPFLERFIAFLDETGPAGLLDFIGDDLSVNSLQIETAAMKAWLARDAAALGRKSDGVLGKLFAGDWTPHGTWDFTGVKLLRDGDAKDRKWRLVGARMRNDLTVFGPAAGTVTKERPVLFAFTHDWAMRLGVSLSLDNFVALAGDVFLEKSYIEAQFPQLRYEYRKPAGEPCSLQLSNCWYAHGRNMVVHLGELKLTGKTLPLEIKDFEANYSRQAEGSIQIGELTVGGLVPWQLTVNKFEPENDRLQGRFIAPALDLSTLTPLVAMPKDFRAQGTLGEVVLTYRGSLIGLEAAFAGNTQDVLKRHPKLEPADPRLKGLNPETDLFTLDAKTRGVKISAVQGGENAELVLDGALKLSTRDMIWKNLTAQLSYTAAKGRFQQVFNSPNLQIATTDPAMNLGRAIRTTGRPLNISADVEFKTPLNVPVLLSAHDIFMAAAGAIPAAAGPQERRLSSLAQLVFNGTLKAPSVIAGTLQTPALDAQNASFKGLRLALPGLQTAYAGGKLDITDVDLDLSKSVIQPDEKLTLKSVGHASRMRLTGATLAKILEVPTAADSYELSGRVDGQGNLVGMDFLPLDRLTWRGAMKLRISELGLKLPGPGAEKFSLPLPEWLKVVDSKPPAIVSALANATLTSTSQPSELLASAQHPRAGSLGNVYGVALSAYLSRAFGMDTERLEFDTIEPTVEVLNGTASSGLIQLVGRGECEGLQIVVKNLKLNLADDSFFDELIIYPVELPRAAQLKLEMARWPEAAQAQFRRDMQGGALALRISGKVANPTVKFPWDEIRLAGMRALFGAERMADMVALQAAQQQFAAAWGTTDEEIRVASNIADRMGIGLPGTVSSRLTGSSFLDRVTGLPQSLTARLSVVGNTVSPFESLKEIVLAKPDVAPPVQPGKDPKNSVPPPAKERTAAQPEPRQ